VNHTIGTHPADKELINRILRGDNLAFGTIIKNTERLVAQIVFKMIPVAEDRKDLAQDIYLKVFHNLPGFKFQAKLSTWIAQIAFNTCLSWIERKKKLLPGILHEEEMHTSANNSSHSIRMSAESGFHGLPNGSEFEARLFQKELSGILQKEIENLPATYQILIILFHQESMSYEELSQITRLPEGTVKSSLFRARKMLKENLLSKYQKEAL
jgi:RNA polymerase sigma factor (sigma-70 family)